MTEYLLRLSWPPSALHSNARVHWAAKARAAKAYRRETWAAAKQAGVATFPNARIEFTFHPPDRRRRDAQNMPGAMKSAIDGIAEAMGCDDHGFRPVFPDALAEPVKGGAVLVHIRPGGAMVELRGGVT